MRDIIITIPQTTDIDVLYTELEATADGQVFKNVKVSQFPKGCKVGDRCHILFRGAYHGYLKIHSFEEKEFVCTTTGNHFKGKFVVLTGGLKLGEKYLDLLDNRYKGFQGFRYWDTWLKANLTS